MSKLRPKNITIESNVKFFGLDSGVSSGSTIAVEFEIPDGLEAADLRRAALEEKERLDLLTLTMELARGAIERNAYESRKKTLKVYYDKLLNRVKDDEETQS